MGPDATLPDREAGPVADWVVRMRSAIRAGGESDVPCGDCTACCRAAHFVHVQPDETESLAAIPHALLSHAPGLPRGHLVLGYDAEGRCPMLLASGCSVYTVRPRACRTYDCRVFAAAGIVPDSPAVARAVSRWRFDVRDDEDRMRLAAVRAAARRLTAEPDLIPGSRSASVRAAAAVDVHGAFLRRDGDTWSLVEPTSAAIRGEISDTGADLPPPRD